ncbi:MAG TPA: cytochrome c biogenesis protein CcsA [Balneolaceae bacterium]|nr:cytochrome c biogenesis protein CcsA [Balneolaceae bacterium]
MIGVIGKVLIDVAFVCSLLAGLGYFFYARNGNDRLFRLSSWLIGAEGILIAVAAGLLLRLILTHQFQYYYVFDYTSRSLQLKYLISAFWGGQEGSFMLWIFFTVIVSLGLMRWTRKPYRGPVLFFMALTQAFLLSMIIGVHIGGLTIGSSPFRTLAEAMPNAAFIKANPHYVPPDGKGLNELLQSPFMVIHPPILFFGFSLMSVPFCFAMAALWRKKYNEWIEPALPWTLGANLCLLTALLLGGYWAYTTLSFGGFWAWDPVENAALVPWLLGTAGIHIMLVQKKNNTSQKASIVFALLAYVGVVYETFLTRSGILGDSSVHSFVDLGLYNQLLIFMLIMIGICVGLFAYRYKDLPQSHGENSFLTREFMTFSGAMVLFLLGLVISIGTSSPIIGKLFTSHPTPPNISFYNDWCYPLAIIAALLTVVGQYIFWKKQDAESLARDLLPSVILACLSAVIIMLVAHIKYWFPLGLLFAGCFAIIGNAFIIVRLLLRKPRLIGGSFAHVGFGILLLGIMASTLFNSNLLDASTRRYNSEVANGRMKDAKGKPIRQKANFLQLKLNTPKVVNNEYKLTYKGYTLKHQTRTGEQQYLIKVQPLHGSGGGITMRPQVYAMSEASPGGKISWSVDPDVHAGFSGDIYLYVAGSSYVERKNKEIAREQKRRKLGKPVGDVVSKDSSKAKTIQLTKGQTISKDGFDFKLKSFKRISTKNLPDSTIVGVQAALKVSHQANTNGKVIHPLFAIYSKNGKNWSYSPAKKMAGENISVRFTKIDPKSGKMTFQVSGISKNHKKPWVLIIAQKKPFISLVWLGTLVVMFGFGIAIFRHWDRERKRHAQI